MMTWFNLLKLDSPTMRKIRNFVKLIHGSLSRDEFHISIFRESRRDPFKVAGKNLEDSPEGRHAIELERYGSMRNPPIHREGKLRSGKGRIKALPKTYVVKYDILNPEELIELAESYLNLDLTNDAAMRMFLEEMEDVGFIPETFNIKGLLREKNPDE
jgi:hypothetical protein